MSGVRELAFTPVFTGPRARMAHLLTPSGSPNFGDLTLCRRIPSAGLWWGTGSWDEMERAKALPMCPRCAAVADTYSLNDDLEG